MAASKKHPRIVPERDVNEGLVEFVDGSRTVPDWQRCHLKAGERTIATTYAEWVSKVVNASMTDDYFRHARGDIVRQHFNR